MIDLEGLSAGPLSVEANDPLVGLGLENRCPFGVKRYALFAAKP